MDKLSISQTQFFERCLGPAQLLAVLFCYAAVGNTLHVPHCTVLHRTVLLLYCGVLFCTCATLCGGRCTYRTVCCTVLTALMGYPPFAEGYPYRSTSTSWRATEEDTIKFRVIRTCCLLCKLTNIFCCRLPPTRMFVSHNLE